MRGYYHVMRGCSEHTVAANEGLLSRECIIMWMREERLCFANSRTPLWGGGCMLTQWVLPCSICGDVRSLCSRICPRLSAPPWKGGVRSRADVLSCRFDGERNADLSLHELITWVPKVHRWSEGRRTTFKKCHTHLNAAEEQPWGLPSNERTLTVSCNILSHNLGSARWRKRFWRIVAGAAFILPLELVIFACFATIGQSLTGVSQ